MTQDTALHIGHEFRPRLSGARGHAAVWLPVLWIAIAASLGACAGSGSPGSNVGGPAASAAGEDGGLARSFERGRWGTFRSRRFELSLSLPDGHAWRIDDHSTPWLQATHAASSSSLRARVWSEPSPVNEARCYGRAREWDMRLPNLDAARVVDDSVHRIAYGSRGQGPGRAGQEAVAVHGRDDGGSASAEQPMAASDNGSVPARVQVGLETSASNGAGASPAGFVVIAAAAVRKCMVVVFRTTCPDAEELAGRLAAVSSRLASSIEMGSALDPSLNAAPPLLGPRQPR